MTTPIYAALVRQKDNGVINKQHVLLGAGVAVDQGYLVVTVAGYGALPAAANNATGKVAGVWISAAQDNTAGANGALDGYCMDGIFDFKNSGANPCAQANVGTTVYAEDFQTVGALNTAGPPAGKLEDFNPADAMPGRPCRVSILNR